MDERRQEDEVVNACTRDLDGSVVGVGVRVGRTRPRPRERGRERVRSCADGLRGASRVAMGYEGG